MTTVKSRSTATAPAVEDPLSEKLWTLAQTAEHLALSESAVGKMARRNEIPSILIGRRRRYQPAAIRRYLARLA